MKNEKAKKREKEKERKRAMRKEEIARVTAKRRKKRLEGWTRGEDKSSKVHSVANKLRGAAPRLPRLLRVTFLRKIGPMEVS